MEDAHSHKKDMVLCYLDFKEVFPSADHKQLVWVLEFLGLTPTSLVLSPASTANSKSKFVTPTDTPRPWVSDGEPYKATPYHLSSSTS